MIDVLGNNFFHFLTEPGIVGVENKGGKVKKKKKKTQVFKDVFFFLTCVILPFYLYLCAQT